MVRTTDDSPAVLSLDRVFDILVSPQRRAVLYELNGRSEPIPLADLAAAISVVEVDGAGTDETTKTADEADLEEGQYRERTVLRLDHVHLPKLQQAGLVEYERTEKTVQLNRIPQQFERYLRFAAEDERQAGAMDATV